MKRDAFIRFMELKAQELVSLSVAAQKEYAHGEDDNCFNNFLRASREVDAHPMKILWVYAMKHKDGIAAWLKGHRSQRESVTGRIKDLIVYLFLLWAWIEENESESKETVN